MDNTKILLVAGAMTAGILLALYLYKRERNNFLVEKAMMTSPEVEYIQGEPDYHVVRASDGGEIIRSGDIALNPGFGIGEGTFGFGRYGSSFSA